MLKVKIGKTYPLADAAQAHIELAGRKTDRQALTDSLTVKR